MAPQLLYNMQPHQPSNQSTDIDLFELLGRLMRFFGRHAVWFLGASIFGVLVGFVAFKIKDKEYRSNMVATSHSLPDGRIIEIVDDLNQLITDQDYPRLAAALGLTVDQARLINDFEVTSFYEMEKKTKKLNDDKMELKESTTFKLNASVKDTALFAPVARGIVSCLTNNTYAQEQLSSHKKALVVQLGEIEHRISLHDSLGQIMQDHLRNSRGTMVISNELSTSQAVVFELESKRAGLNQELERLQEVRVIKPFTIFKKSRWPKLSISASIGFLIANICTILGILILGPRFRKQ
jgi:hypothetical protein